MSNDFRCQAMEFESNFTMQIKGDFIANMSTCDRLSFHADWYQEEAGVTRKFLVNFFPYDGGIEIFDLKTNKTFLRRTRLGDANESDFHVGAKVNIFGRRVRLVAYADESTRKRLAGNRQRAFGLVKPEGVQHIGEIVKFLNKNDFQINNCAMFELEPEHCSKLAEQESNHELAASGIFVALELIGRDAVRRLSDLIGCNSDHEISNDLHFGIDLIRKSMHFSRCNEIACKQLEFFFGPKNFDSPKLAVSFEHTTLAIIKPHAMRKHLGPILSEITENGFTFKGMKLFNLDRENCAEFLEVYKGVVPEYLQMVNELSSGPFLVLVIGSDCSSANVHHEFRQLCGPADPNLAKEIRPKSIRAKFGQSKVQNAIHCTDLEEDCRLEVEYFFKILS